MNHISYTSPRVFPDKGFDCDDCKKNYIEPLNVAGGCAHLLINDSLVMGIVRCDTDVNEYSYEDDCTFMLEWNPGKICACDGLCYVVVDPPLEKYKPKIKCNGSYFCEE